MRLRLRWEVVLEEKAQLEIERQEQVAALREELNASEDKRESELDH